eukprot:2304119-Amphidinium_carterae.1
MFAQWANGGAFRSCRQLCAEYTKASTLEKLGFKANLPEGEKWAEEHPLQAEENELADFVGRLLSSTLQVRARTMSHHLTPLG